MARVTVEDCLEKVSSPYDLVELAVARVEIIKQTDETADPISSSVHSHQGEERSESDRLIVRALREISAGKVDPTIVHDREKRRKEYEFNAQTRTVTRGPSDTLHEEDSNRS